MDKPSSTSQTNISRRTVISGSSAALAAIMTASTLGDSPAEAAVAGYNLPFTNQYEPNTVLPTYDASDGWHTRPGGGHHGIDFNGPASAGRRVFPIRSGTVNGSYEDFYLGNVVSVLHGNGYQSRYCHLASRSVGDGQAVGPGTLLGTVGNTGESSGGAHLHLELRPSPSLHDIDPWPYLSGAPYANEVGDDELTPEQDSMLTNLYNAMFLGGGSMPSGMSLVSILQPGKVTRNGSLPNPGTVGEFSLFQEVADAKTFLLKQQIAVAELTAKIDAISARLP